MVYLFQNTIVYHGFHGIGETGANFTQGQVVTESFYENSTDVEIPSTVVGWKSTNRHTVQKSGVKKTKLTRCGQQLLLIHLKPFGHAHKFSSQAATFYVSLMKF